MRMTSQRALILKYLRGVKTHPTAATIYEKVRQQLPNISYGTIYSNLKVLKKAGLIKELELKEASHFDGNTSAHYHFLCRRCGKVEDIDIALIKGIVKKAAAATDNEIESHEIIFTGKCRNCNQNSKGEKHGN